MAQLGRNHDSFVFPLSQMQARGVRDILGVDVAVEMLDKLKESFGSAPPLGNEPAVRTWLGDFMELPTYMV